MQPNRRDIKPNFVSLYSGCGGMDLGFLKAGFDCIHAYDFDKAAVDSHAKNISSNISQKDLSNVDDELLSNVGKADVLVAGPPCQGFSTAGKNNPNDERNSHLRNVALIAAKAKPKAVVIENVRGLLSATNKHHFENTQAILTRAGYQVTWDIHNSADHGVAQNRKRVVIFATLSDQKFNLVPRCEARQTLNDVLRSSDPENGTSNKLLCKKSDDYKIANRIRPGQKLSNVRSGNNSVHTWEIPEVYGRVSKEEISFLETIVKLRRQQRRRPNGDADPVCRTKLAEIFGHKSDDHIQRLIDKKYLREVDDHIDLTNTFNGKYRRLEWDQAAPTVDTRFGQPRYFLHPDQHRGFSTSEAAKIQSFPDCFEFIGSESAIYRMIGNAVPPKFAETLAQNVKEIWAKL